MAEFPGNSQRAKPPRDEPAAIASKDRKIERVVQGEVIRRKRPIGKRIRELFVPGDAPSVWEYVVGDILVPNIRDMFVDATIGSVERMVYGESRAINRRHPSRYGRPSGPTNYNAFASQPNGRAPAREDPRQPAMSRRARANHDFEEILIPSRQEAEMVLQGMYDILEQYNEVAVRDLYELTGVSAQFTDERWGWTNLFGARPERTRSGYYVLSLPKPELLER